MTSTYLPIINGNYGMNGILNNFNPKLIEDKKLQAKEIINCINVNFEKLLTLTTGSIGLYQKEMVKNNQRMSGIDENLDSLFYLVQNLNQNIIDINDKIKVIDIDANFNKNMMEQIKEYVGLQINSLRLDLSLIHGEIMESFDRSTKRDTEPSLALQYDINTVSAPIIIDADNGKKKSELQFDFNVLKHEVISTVHMSQVTLQLDENVSNIKYTSTVLKDFATDHKNLATAKNIVATENIEGPEKKETEKPVQKWYWKGKPITLKPQENKLSKIVLPKDVFKHDKCQEEPPGT
eukprot:269980_1